MSEEKAERELGSIREEAGSWEAKCTLPPPSVVCKLLGPTDTETEQYGIKVVAHVPYSSGSIEQHVDKV